MGINEILIEGYNNQINILEKQQSVQEMLFIESYVYESENLDVISEGVLEAIGNAIIEILQKVIEFVKNAWSFVKSIPSRIFGGSSSGGSTDKEKKDKIKKIEGKSDLDKTTKEIFNKIKDDNNRDIEYIIDFLGIEIKEVEAPAGSIDQSLIDAASGDNISTSLKSFCKKGSNFKKYDRIVKFNEDLMKDVDSVSKILDLNKKCNEKVSVKITDKICNMPQILKARSNVMKPEEITKRADGKFSALLQQLNAVERNIKSQVRLFSRDTDRLKIYQKCMSKMATAVNSVASEMAKFEAGSITFYANVNKLIDALKERCLNKIEKSNSDKDSNKK